MNQTTATPSVFSPSQRIEYSQNGIVSQQIAKKSSGNITLFAFDKGQQLSEHSSPFDAVVHIVEGTADIHIAGELYHLHTGEMIILPADIPHAVYAPEPFKMLLTMIRGQQ